MALLEQTQRSDAIDLILVGVKNELLKAMEHHGPMTSPHEGWAVILEEVDELWDEVKKKHGGRDMLAAKEAIQVAAMACRYLYDVVET